MQTVQTTHSHVHPTPAPRRQRLMPRVTLVAYRFLLEVLARMPVIGGMVVLRSFLSPPRTSSRVSADDRALWHTATQETIRVGHVTCPLYRWTPAGSSRGHAVVCHGWAADASSMRSVIRDLIARGFTVWAPEAPAHGRAGGRLSSLPDFIRTLHAVLEKTGPVDVVIGHSFGAAATAMAVTGYPPLGPPRAVGGVVLISSPHHHRTYPDFFIRLLGLSETIRRKLYARLDHRFGPVETIRTIGAQLSTLSCPLMLIHDEQDVAVPVHQLDHIVSSLRADQPCTVLRTKGLGHVRGLTDSTVVEAVGDFADRCLQGDIASHPSYPSNETVDREANDLSISSLADFLRTQIRATPSETLAKQFKEYLRLMRLTELDVETYGAAGEKIRNCLHTPPAHAELIALIDATARNATANPFLVEAVRQLAHDGLNDWRRRNAPAWTTDAVDVVIYAAFMQRLTAAMRRDWRLVRDLIKGWRVQRKHMRWRKHAQRFVILKLLSIEYPFMKLLKFFEANAVPPSSIRTSLRINILEAVAFDLGRGLTDNAAAGTVLARYGHRGASATHDAQALRAKLPCGRSWADLYTVWNIGFVMHYANFPWALVKLLIPQVSDYGAEGDEYLYNRVIALYIHVHACAFRSIERGQRTSKTPARRRKSQYRCDRLLKIWGASTRRSADAFSASATNDAPKPIAQNFSNEGGNRHARR